jgi:hypothetical protein
MLTRIVKKLFKPLARKDYTLRGKINCYSARILMPAAPVAAVRYGAFFWLNDGPLEEAIAWGASFVLNLIPVKGRSVLERSLDSSYWLGKGYADNFWLIKIADRPPRGYLQPQQEVDYNKQF